MAQTGVPQVLHLGFMIPVGDQDLEADDLTSKNKRGKYSFVVDDFGDRIFRYFRNRSSASFSLGDFISRVGDLNALTIVSASTGSTVRAGLLAPPLTASQEIGNILIVNANNDSAGAAPEGEVGIIVSNTSGYINVDSARPFTTAIAASDILWIEGTFNTEFSVGLPTPDTAFTVYGCVVAQLGVTDDQFGWSQVWGRVPQANYSSGAVTVGTPLVIASTTAECTGQASASLLNIIGWAPVSVTGALNTATGKAMAFLQLGFGTGPRSTQTT